MHLWEGEPWTGKRGRALFSPPRWGQSALVTRWALFLHSTASHLWPPQGLLGRRWVASDPPCLLALYFIQRRAVTFFICLHTRFPRKSSFEAGLPGLSSVSTSACQQVAMPVLPLMLILIRTKQISRSVSVSQLGEALPGVFPDLVYVYRIFMSRSLPVFATMKRSWVGLFYSFDIYIIMFSHFLWGKTCLQYSCSHHVFLFWYLILVSVFYINRYINISV